MTGERSRVVAIQALIVGLLMAVVFLTLLQPEGEDPLQGIRGPGGAPPTPAYIPAEPGDDASGGRAGGTGGPADGEGGGEPALGLVAAPAPGTQVPAATGGGNPSAEGSSPTTDQYADTLARLDAKLH